MLKASTGRALGGLSMGGGQTLAFGFGNVDVFTHLSIFSPAPNSPSPPANAFTDLEATKRDVKFIYLSCSTVEQPYRGGAAHCVSMSRQHASPTSRAAELDGASTEAS